MAFLRWLSRCAPGLSLIVLLIFLECTLGVVRAAWNGNLSPTRGSLSHVGGHILQWIFIVYTCVLHTAAWFFPMRLCWATWAAANKVEEAHREEADDDTKSISEKSDEGYKSDETIYVEEIAADQVQIIMVLIVPCYKEDISTIEDTLSVLGSHVLAKDSYDIYLAMEERDPNGVKTAQQVINTFSDRFMNMQYTVHPAGIPGEAPGKSSNVSWAAKEVERTYSGRPEWKNVLVTVMDSDTHLLTQYFQHLRASHLRNRKSGYLTDMTLYMPPIIFDRNAHQVPRLVRVADLMWCSAGLSCFQPVTSPTGVGIPTAVYSLPLALVHMVGGWDTDPGAIGEDLHMMLKCYFATNGRMRIESIPSPASQCNITAEGHGWRGWVAGLNARYNQGLRHMWGSLDTGFAIRKWAAMGQRSTTSTSSSNDSASLQRANMPRRGRKLSHTELSLKLSQYALHGCEPRRFTLRNFIVFSRLFEAHFLPAHLFLIIILSAGLTPIIKRSPDLKMLYYALDITNYMRLLSYFVMVAYFAVFYERYHRICVTAREREMLKAGLHAQMADQFSRRGQRNWHFWPDYFLFPVSGMLFGAVCLFQAVFSHFWTDKLVYLVSAKPIRALVAAKDVAVEKVAIASEVVADAAKAV